MVSSGPKGFLPGSPYRARFIEIALVQSLFLLLFAINLDGGVLCTAYVIPMVAYWMSVGVLALRVRGKYSRRDLLYINRSWLLILPLGMISVLIVRELF